MRSGNHCLARVLDIFVLLALLSSSFLIALNISGPGQRLVDVDVYVPQSFKPFHNIGSRIGIHTEWSLTTLKIHNIITQKLDEVIKIDDLANLYDNLTSSVDFLPETNPLATNELCPDGQQNADCNPTLQIIKTIQRSTHILRTSLKMTLAAFSIASVLYIIFLASQRQLIITTAEPLVEPPSDPLRASSNEYMLRLPLRSVEERTQVYGRSGPSSFGMLCYRLAVILAMLGCLGLCMMVITHFDDILGNVQKILPMLIRKLSWICLTHNSEECKILHTVRPEALGLVGILVTVFLTALATTALRF